MRIYNIDNIEIDKLDIRYNFYINTSNVDMNIINSIVWVLSKEHNINSVSIHRECFEITLGKLTSSWLVNRYYYKNIIILNNKLYLSDNKNDILIIKRLNKIKKIKNETSLAM